MGIRYASLWRPWGVPGASLGHPLCVPWASVMHPLGVCWASVGRPSGVRRASVASLGLLWLKLHCLQVLTMVLQLLNKVILLTTSFNNASSQLCQILASWPAASGSAAGSATEWSWPLNCPRMLASITTPTMSQIALQGILFSTGLESDMTPSDLILISWALGLFKNCFYFFYKNIKLVFSLNLHFLIIRHFIQH